MDQFTQPYYRSDTLRGKITRQRHVATKIRLREAAKKNASTNGQAIKRGWGGGGVKAGPLRKKITFFWTFCKFCRHLKIKIILL